MTATLHPTTTRKLQAFARRRRLLLVVRGLCALAVSFLGSMTLIALLDRLILLPDAVRLGLSAAAYATVLAALWFQSLRPFLRRRRSAEMAELFGAACPALGDDLLSAVELGSDSSDPQWDSPEFRQMLQRSVAGRLSDLPVAPLLPWRLIAPWLLAAAALALLVVALAAVPSLRFPRLIARAIVPPANLARVSTTTIELLAPADPEAPVPQGDPITITVAVSGRPDSVTLRTFPQGQSSAAVRLEPQSQEGQYSVDLDVGRQELTYRIEAGDAITRRYTLRAMPRPEAVKFAKTYHYPAYAHLEPKQVIESNGDIAALEGTTVTLWLYADQPVKEATLGLHIAGKTETIALSAQPAKEISERGRIFSASIPVQANGSYQVHLVAAETGFENKFSPRYDIRAVADLRPSAEIVEPRTGLRVEPDASLVLRGSARDDVGLASVAQMVRINQGAWSELVLLKNPGAEATIDQAWDLHALGLQTGDLVTTKLVATDLKGNVGESEPVQLAIASRDVATQPAPAGNLSSTLKTLAEAAQKLADQSGGLANKAGQTQDVQPLGGQARQLVQEQRQLDQKLAQMRDMLRRDADGQDMLTPEGREAARDDDDAIAMLREKTPTLQDRLNRAADAADGSDQKEALRSASVGQGELAQTLRTLAEHFDKLEAGQPQETRPALRAAEDSLGIKATLDTQYGQVARLAEMARLAPEQLKPALENELTRNGAMQGELSQIAQQTLEQAQADLHEAAGQEQRIAEGLESQAQGAGMAEGAQQQPAIGAAVEQAAAAIERAGQDAQRLNQARTSQALREAAAQARSAAGQEIPQAKKSLESQSPAAAQQAVKNAAEAIGKSAKGAAGKGDIGKKPEAAQAANRGGKGGAGGEPAEAASKWMAAALDQLDRAGQAGRGGGGGGKPEGEAKNSQGAAGEGAAGGNGAGQGAAGQGAAGGSAKGGDAAGGSAGGEGTPAAEGSQAGGSGGEGGAEGEGPAEAAGAMMQAAAEAQAQAMRDGRLAGGNSGGGSGDGGSGSGGGSGAGGGSGGGSGGGGASVVGSRAGQAISGTRPTGGGDWGKLTPQQARDLMEARRENIPSEYREKIEAYFRAIAEKAERKGQE